MTNDFVELASFGNGIRERVGKLKYPGYGSVKEIYKSTDDDRESYFIGLNGDAVRQGMREDAVYESGLRIKRLLRKHCIGKKRLVLAVGIGNGGMTADSLGTKTVAHINATEQFYPFRGVMRGLGRVACIAPGVGGATGVQSYDVVGSVSSAIGADAIIAIDTLSCRQISRLGSVIQITDGGIVPGSGVGKAVKELTERSLGIPVIAIGVPLVIYAKNIVAEYAFKTAEGVKELGDTVVTVKDIDPVSDAYADIISAAIDFAVHGGNFKERSRI